MTMTNQEALDRVVRHLAAQGERAVDANGYCVYRCGELRCAVGALIPDVLYTSDMDSDDWSVFDLVRCVPNLADLDTDLLVEMQAAHDQTPVAGWDEQYRDIARTFGLSDKLIDQVEWRQAHLPEDTGGWW